MFFNTANWRGPRGLSAYEVAKADGYTGTQEEWVASLKGEKGPAGTTQWDGLTDKPTVLVVESFDASTGVLKLTSD